MISLPPWSFGFDQDRSTALSSVEVALIFSGFFGAAGNYNTQHKDNAHLYQNIHSNFNKIL